MEFQERVQEYRECTDTKSPIWIWFLKHGETSLCQICKTYVKVSTKGSTSNLAIHLRRHHGNKGEEYNAFEQFEELSELKQQRLNKPPRFKRVAEPDEQPIPKKTKKCDSALQLYKSRMDFQDQVCDYREGKAIHSPIWIWFKGNGETSLCQICDTYVRKPPGTSSNLQVHLKRHHGENNNKYNAFEEYKELCKLKEKRLNKNKRCSSVVELHESPIPREQKTSDSAIQQYSPSLQIQTEDDALSFIGRFINRVCPFVGPSVTRFFQ